MADVYNILLQDVTFAEYLYVPRRFLIWYSGPFAELGRCLVSCTVFDPGKDQLHHRRKKLRGRNSWGMGEIIYRWKKNGVLILSDRV